jgi:hypothetical protein
MDKGEETAMKRNVTLCALCLVIGMMFAANGIAGEVSQGKCLEYNTEAKTIKVEEYDTNISKDSPYGKTTGIVSEFNCSTAKIGMKPEAGDILRISYEPEGSTKKALKVMNVSKQDLRKK